MHSLHHSEKVFALAAWRARRGAKHRAEGEARKAAAALAATPNYKLN